MRKLLSFLIIAALILSTGCGVEKQNAKDASEATSQSASSAKKSKPSSSKTTPTPKKKKLTKKEKYQRYAKKIKVKVYNKKNLPIDFNVGRYAEFIELDYKVINKSPKAIKGVKGTLDIYDQFDDFIMSINWDVSVGKIGAGKTRKVTHHGLDYNQFMDNHRKVHDLNYEDMIFKFEMEQVNFSDGYKLKL